MATTDHPGRRTQLLIASGLILNVLLLAGAGYFWFSPRPQPANSALATEIGGPFTMSDQRGHIVTSEMLMGKPFAIFFGFTRCPEVCPTTLSRMSRLRKTLGPAGDRFNIVFVSVDPEQDKPADLGRYLSLFETPIIGLTGTPEQLAAIVKAYHVYYRKVPIAGGDYTVDHTAAVYLMGPDGRFQTLIDYQGANEMALAKLRHLIG